MTAALDARATAVASGPPDAFRNGDDCGADRVADLVHDLARLTLSETAMTAAGTSDWLGSVFDRLTLSETAMTAAHYHFHHQHPH